MVDWPKLFSRGNSAKTPGGALVSSDISATDGDGASASTIEVAWSDELAPVFRRNGFKGSGRNFRATSGDFLLAVNLQGSRFGKSFAINLGVQPAAIPDVRGNPVDPKSIKELECVFRERLTYDGHDTWWDYDQNLLSMRSAAREAAGLFETRGMDQFQSRMNFALNVKPEGVGKIVPMVYVSLALFRETQGKLDEARAFARIASEHATSHWVSPNSIRHLLVA